MASTEVFEVTIPSNADQARAVQERILQQLDESDFSMRDIFGVRLALEEALVNAIKHGNRMDPNKSVKVTWEVNSEGVRVVIEDQGCGFNIGAVPDPTADENLDKPGGRGIMLMRSFMNVVEYNDIGNQVTLERIREQPKASDMPLDH